MARSSDDDDDDPHGREFYSIPSSSSWFQWDEIHDEERLSLPEFFDGASASRNPRVYKEYRDFIISKYREDPARRLTFTDVRNSLVGDVGYLHKVFSFLDRCGLINFGAPPPQPVLAAAEDAGLKVVVEEGAPGGVHVVPAFAPRKRVAPAAAVGGGESGFKLPPLTSYSDVFGHSEPQMGILCVGCGNECVSRGYECTEAGLVICLKCSGNKSQTGGETANGINDRADVTANHLTIAWTDAETLLLLEAVLKHGDDWDLIAQHVRTKNKLDCILRLIHLPFGEHMLGGMNGKYDDRNLISLVTDVQKLEHVISEPPQEPNKKDDHDKTDAVAEESVPVSPSKRRCFPPYGDATRSLMKQVAHLSTLSGPEIAAAAAEAAIMALCIENPCARKAFDINEDQESKLLSANKKSNSELMSEDQYMNDKETEDMPDLKPEKNFGARVFQIRAAIATGLGSAAARAKLLADQEEREMELLMASIIEAQIRKLQYKIKHFEELEFIMEKEYLIMQNMKESILDEWVAVIEQSFQAGISKWKDHGQSKPLLNNSTL